MTTDPRLNAVIAARVKENWNTNSMPSRMIEAAAKAERPAAQRFLAMLDAAHSVPEPVLGAYSGVVAAWLERHSIAEDSFDPRALADLHISVLHALRKHRAAAREDSVRALQEIRAQREDAYAVLQRIADLEGHDPEYTDHDFTRDVLAMVKAALDPKEEPAR